MQKTLITQKIHGANSTVGDRPPPLVPPTDMLMLDAIQGNRYGVVYLLLWGFIPTRSVITIITILIIIVSLLIFRAKMIFSASRFLFIPENASRSSQEAPR